MPCIELSGTLPQGLNAFETYQVYNALDAAVTAQLVPEMLSFANEQHRLTYDREMRMQALCLEMSSKGFPVGRLRVLELTRQLDTESTRALSILHCFCEAVYYPPLNPRSPLQVAEFFYDFLKLPIIWKLDFKTKQRRRATDRDSLEKLRAMYPIAVPFVNAILAFRESSKLASVFKKGLEPSGVLRCNTSPSGTETGRFSSQSNVYGRGTNGQNLNDRVRQVVEAPRGWVLVNLDLKTAESIAVGFLSGDRGYIEACLGGDLHTAVASLTWRNLPWTGDLKQDRALAEQPFYRDFTYRDMAKRGGHGTNYYGTPRTMATHLKVQTALIENFQRGYFAAFPGIVDWHIDTISRVQRDGVLVTPLGRERRFWGRSGDPATHREAIAFVPQSTVADVMNEGLHACQRWLLKERLHVHEIPARLGNSVAFTRGGLLAQIHDAGLFLLPESEWQDIAAELLKIILYPVDFGELGTMIIPAEASVGRRWSKKPKKHKPGLMDGLQDWAPGQQVDLGSAQ